MRIPKSFSVTGLIVALAACAPGTVLVLEPVATQNYTVDHYQMAAINKEIRTQVYGEPFVTEAQGFGATVLGHMEGADGQFGMTYTPSPRAPGSGPYHVVVALNPTPGTDPQFICGNRPTIETMKATDRLTMLAAFCIHDTLLSTAEGTAFGVARPEHPAVRKLARQVTLALFPAYDHYDIGGDSGPSN